MSFPLLGRATARLVLPVVAAAGFVSVAVVPADASAPVSPLVAPSGELFARAAKSPVLGVSGYLKYGKGWGKPHPKTIFNGGVPSGLVQRLKWTGWGTAEADARGKTATYKPEGGYYSKLVKIKLRALGLASCPQHPSRPAYTRLLAQVQTKPGGKYGDWFPWALDLCDYDATAATCDSVDFGDGGSASSVTQWDTDCATASSVAQATATTTLGTPTGPYDPINYRLETAGFVCNGYSFPDETTISWTCNRETAVVSFTQNTP
jgi:hypothetical protein